MGLMPQSQVRVHIDRLVVHGLGVRDRAALGAAVATELERLLAEHDWRGAESVAVERVEAGAIRPPVAARESALGAQIAAAVMGGLPQ
jgi:hypothetical protein